MPRTRLIWPSLSLAFSLLSLSGCATITRGTNESISVATVPPGATCVLRRDGEPIFTVAPTPGTATVSKSSHDIAVDCTMPGHTNGAAVIPAGPQPVAAGNIVTAGLGLIVDLGTGAASEYPHGVCIWLDQLDMQEVMKGRYIERSALDTGFTYPPTTPTTYWSP